MKLTEMRQILTAEGIELTRSLGQNFLHDAHQLQRIVVAGELSDQDNVLEIGPGLGPLTQLLVEKAGSVLAIEKDRRLVEFLKPRYEKQPRLTLVLADALDYLREKPRNWAGWKLVANLPYSVASPILVELARAAEPPERMTVTLQWEVVRRLAAKEDTDDYGLLTLLVQRAFEPGEFFKIPPGCFFPVPDVESACITLKRRSTPLLPRGEIPSFEKVIKRAFSQRRKMMLKLLKADWPLPVLTEIFNEMGLSLQIRAEKVSLDQFVRLTQRLLAQTQKKPSA